MCKTGISLYRRFDAHYMKKNALEKEQLKKISKASISVLFTN